MDAYQIRSHVLEYAKSQKETCEKLATFFAAKFDKFLSTEATQQKLTSWGSCSYLVITISGFSADLKTLSLGKFYEIAAGTNPEEAEEMTPISKVEPDVLMYNEVFNCQSLKNFIDALTELGFEVYVTAGDDLAVAVKL